MSSRYIALQTVRLGDRGRSVRGWLIISGGAVRGVLSEGPEGSILFGFACDRRIAPEGELMVFRDLGEAHAWLEKRLPTWHRPIGRTGADPTWRVEPADPPLTVADAERAFIAAAADYCLSIRHRALPERGPLARPWRAFTGYRRLCRPPHAEIEQVGLRGPRP